MAFSRVVRDLQYQEVPMNLESNQYFCVNIHPAGNLLFQVKIIHGLIQNDQPLVAQLPSKFDKKILFGRGDMCICTFNDGENTDEIGRIDMLLTKENIRDLIKEGRLPPSTLSEEVNKQTYVLEDRESSDSYY